MEATDMGFKVGDKVTVSVSRGRYRHNGVVIGFDEVFKDTIIIGVVSTTLPRKHVKRPDGFISIFYASAKQLTPRN
jgi:hypothetical protein